MELKQTNLVYFPSHLEMRNITDVYPELTRYDYKDIVHGPYLAIQILSIEISNILDLVRHRGG